MKKTLKTILSLAFALLLVFQFAGSMDAYAAGEFTYGVSGGVADATCTVLCNGKDLASCSVANAEKYGIVISPDEDEDYIDYVASVSIDGTPVALVATNGTKVTVSAETIKDLGLAAGASVDVSLSSVAKKDSVTLEYFSGEANLSGDITDGSTVAEVNQHFIAPSLTAEAKSAALEKGLEFVNWELEYDNGAVMEVAAGDSVVPYTDFSLTAQWKAVTSIRIEPAAQQKYYDGTAALAKAEAESTDDYNVYIFNGSDWQQVKDYKVKGLKFTRTGDAKDEAKVGTYTFKASDATVTDSKGNVVKNVFYSDGIFEIVERPLTLKVKDTETDYTSYKLYPKGIEVVEPTTLAPNQSIDTESIKYDNVAVRVSNMEFNIKSVIIRDSKGNDVTANYDITTQAGRLKVNPVKISIAPDDYTVAYDGKAHTITYKITSGDLCDNDSIKVISSPGGAVQAGEYKDRHIESVVITNNLVEKDATGSYIITLDTESTAKLTITAHYLRLRPVSKTIIYDGPATSLMADDFEIVEGSLLPGHEVAEGIEYEGSINVVADGVGVTKYSNIIVSTISIIDADGNDVTKLYNIETERGTLRIEPIDIVIIAGSNSASYSGNPITPDPKFTLVGKLLEGHALVDVVVSGSQTYVGETVTKVTSYDIVDTSNNISVKGNNYYRVTLNDGKLIVTENPNKPMPDTVTVSVKSLSKTYDGKPLSLSADDYTVTDSKNAIPSGYTLKVTVDTATSITDAGSVNIAAPTVEVYKDNVKVTDYPFVIDAKGGTLTVNKLVVTLTAASASKKYDGKALTCAKLASGGATVANSTGKLVGDHTLNMNDIVFQGSQTNVGSSANKIISATIRDGNGNSVNKNYQINFIDGVLTVTSAAGTGTGTVAGGAASGDNSNIGLWVAIMAVLAVAAAAVVFIFFKKKKADQ